MNVYWLKDKVKNTESHYFDHDTLKFFGERMSEMRVLKGYYTITDYSGVKHECVCLSKLQRNYPSGARRSYDYFDTTTWERIFPNE